jgi:hypothetical protein
MAASLGGYTSTATGAIYTIILDNQPKVQPQCGKCTTATATIRTKNGALWCRACHDEALRQAEIAHAPAWLEAAFRATRADRRKRLYRALSTVFHPDAGGDPMLMVALNAVHEKFP